MNINNLEKFMGTYMLSRMLKKSASSSENNSMAFDIMLESLSKSMSVSENNKNESNKAFKTPLGVKLDTIDNTNWNFKNVVIESNDKIVDKNSDKEDKTVEQVVNKEDIKVDKNNSTRERVDNAIRLYSKKYGVDEKLVRAIAKQESNFNPNVVSSAGAVGVMQLMPETAKYLGVKDIYNIEQNIEGGVKYIKEQLDRYGNVDMALMAYNAGMGTVQKRGVKSPDDLYKMPKETQNYVKKVNEYYNKL